MSPRNTPSELVNRLTTVSRRPAGLGTVPPGTVSLAMGEPFADTPSTVVDAATEALARGRTRYAPQTGEPALRETLAEKLSAHNEVAIHPEEIVLTHGASSAIAATIFALVNSGDRVVVPEPTYSLYADHIAMAGGVVDWAANHPDGRLNFELLAQKMGGARAVVVCNPSNPTGRVIPQRDVVRLVALAAEHDVTLICDEAYADIVFDGVHFQSVLGAASAEVVCLGTFSKSYAMTGWRLGYAVAPQPLADRINLVHRTINGSLNTFVQDAAQVALALPDEYFNEMTAAYQRRRDLVVDHLSELPFVTLARPEGAFYAFPQITSTLTSEQLTSLLAREGRLLVRSGSEYGPSGEGFLRISFAADIADLEEGLSRFSSTLTRVITEERTVHA